MSIKSFTIYNPTVLLDGEPVGVKVTQAVITLEESESDQLDLILTTEKDRIRPKNLGEMCFNVSGTSNGEHLDFELTGSSLIHQTVDHKFLSTIFGTCRKLSDKHI